MAAAIIDEDLATDHSLAVLEAVREQLSAIEAALPDYGPSFSALEQQTQQIKSQLDRIAASPSVKLSPDQQASIAARTVSAMLAPSLAQLQNAAESAEHRQTELGRLLQTVHVRSMRRPLPLLWSAVALVVGFWLYPLIAATAPGGTNFAALAAGHRNPWVAGGSLMNAHNPEAWAAIVKASQILAQNQDAFTRCVAAADRVAAIQTCSIQVGPTAGQR